MPDGAPLSYDRIARWSLWDEDTLFDVVEVLFDVVSEGVDGSFHNFNHCGWHYRSFDRAKGRRIYRERMNEVLALHDPPYEMTDGGEIVAAAPSHLGEILQAPLPAGTEHAVTDRVDSAVHRFRARGASLDDRRHAVRDLADVLERLRPQIKIEMLKRDEADLFNLANNFAVRHHNPGQKAEYDGAVWLTWMFYVFLATIHAVTRVAASQRGAT